jgi:RNA polymerase sigma factor (sigma-70 family)
MAARLFVLNDESDMIARVRRGDRKALLALFDMNRRSIVSLITRNGGSSDEAEDVLQDAVIVLWERIRSGRFEQKAAMGTFLYAVAKRLWLQRLAKRKREPVQDIDPDTAAGDDAHPGEEAEREEEEAAVRSALGRLDAPCRSLLLLFYWECLPMEEIASLLGYANAQTMKAKKYQCKERLRHLLKELDHDT